MFEWNESFSVRIGSIDAQHRQLFQIGADLLTAMNAGESRSKMGSILDRLVQYTTAHFAHEERLLRQAEYPAYDAHKKMHDELTVKVRDFQASFESGRTAMSVQMLNFLKNWLQGHIMTADREYESFLRTAETVAAPKA